jgi:sensor histidine kinase regulating citrate/malate metabolism
VISTARAQDWAEISISDTGAGIPEAIRSRVFEPFFTTKPVGQGNGARIGPGPHRHREAARRERYGSTLKWEREPHSTFASRLPKRRKGDPWPNESCLSMTSPWC